MIIMLTWPSGAWKDSVWQWFCNQWLNSEFWLERVITTTTRERRVWEENGREYYFIEKNEFEEKIKNWELVEYADVYGNFYWSTFSELERIINKWNKVFYEVDPQWVKYLKEALKDDYDVYTIFIMPPSKETLEERLIQRWTESQEDLQKRLNEAEKQISEKNIYDYNIINDDLEKAVEEFKQIIKSI